MHNKFFPNKERLFVECARQKFETEITYSPYDLINIIITNQINYFCKKKKISHILSTKRQKEQINGIWLCFRFRRKQVKKLTLISFNLICACEFEALMWRGGGGNGFIFVICIIYISERPRSPPPPLRLEDKGLLA